MLGYWNYYLAIFFFKCSESNAIPIWCEILCVIEIMIEQLEIYIYLKLQENYTLNMYES